MSYESPLFWPAQLKDDALFVLDETLLPRKTHYIKVRDVKSAVKVIREMKTRAFGQFLVVLNTFLLEINNQLPKGPGNIDFPRLKEIADALNNSRPTFPFSEVTGIILMWAKQAEEKQVSLAPFLQKNINGFLMGIRQQRLGRVNAIASLIKDGQTVLTHCNVSGELAMAAALCQEQGKKVKFFATETRPYFQGAKLTCWELRQAGADVVLIADNAIGTILRERLADLVIVGSDRSCANGDIANKIGTYQIAVLASEYGIPFYALTQPSKGVARGEEIPIEIRDENELLKFNRKRITLPGVKGFYPGFDVVPQSLITQSLSLNVN